MKTKTIYMTEDGKKFNNKEAAMAHEKELANADTDKLDDLLEQIKKNNDRMDEINEARVSLMKHIDALDKEFDKVRTETEKLFKEYYGEDKYEEIYKTLNKMISEFF